jgi:glycosyltransferase involved in cell wall biosynthesis
MPAPLSVSVVVPARNAARTLGTVLVALRESDLPRDSYEIIVVDDSSSDASATIAARHADTVIRLNGRVSGPAYARNRGAELARAEVVIFVDADVVVRPDTLPRMLATLAAHPSLDAVSASHGERAGAPNFVSQYWNLLLRFGEQRHAGARAHFTSGCAAVRRSAFLSAGMYDEWRFGTAGLESLEFGQRLHGAGHDIFLDPALEVTHLTHWTTASVCREAWHRSTLLARSLGYQRTSVEAPGEVVFTLSRALTPALAVLATLTLAAAFLPQPYISSETAIALGALLLGNLSVYRFYANTRGLGFALAASPLHLCVQVVSAVALCTGWVLRDAVGDILPDATTQAYSEVGLEIWPPVPRRL